MLSVMIHIVAWFLVIVMALGILTFLGVYVVYVFAALLSPFSKKIEKFYDDHFRGGGWSPWSWF